MAWPKTNEQTKKKRKKRSFLFLSYSSGSNGLNSAAVTQAFPHPAVDCWPASGGQHTSLCGQGFLTVRLLDSQDVPGGPEGICVTFYNQESYGITSCQNQRFTLIQGKIVNDFTFTFHIHALEKETATHSSILAWRIQGTGEPGGLPSMRLHRVRHD